MRYFPGINIATFTEADKQRLVEDIDADLAVSGAIVPLLPASSRKKEPPMSADKVLIVEDDSSIGMVVRSALEAEGIEVDVCESASARDAALAGNR